MSGVGMPDNSMRPQVLKELLSPRRSRAVSFAATQTIKQAIISGCMESIGTTGTARLPHAECIQLVTPEAANNREYGVSGGTCRLVWYRRRGIARARRSMYIDLKDNRGQSRVLMAEATHVFASTDAGAPGGNCAARKRANED